jgi:hypothetical protein
LQLSNRVGRQWLRVVPHSVIIVGHDTAVPDLPGCADGGDVSGEVTSDATVPEDVGDETTHRSPARSLWAMLLARLYEIVPLTCPLCGGPMRIIAFITDGPVIRHILDSLGEPSRPPPIAAARGPPVWDREAAEWDAPPVDSEPEDSFDQTVSW